jgi:ATP-dependent Clp protease protease subunit
MTGSSTPPTTAGATSTSRPGFVIKFYTPVNESSIGQLMKTADQKLAAGAKEFTVLISTSGASVFHGLTAYNYLKGIPATVTTHNIGSVDSIGVALYCAGQRRISVPQARFLLHPVSMNFRESANYEEPKLMELVKSLRVDMENCASVIAANTRQTKRHVLRAMLSRHTIDPERALEWGLVHEIRQELFAEGTEVVPIQSGS